MSSDLPHDILFDILSRLPAKSLGQLKSVCKSWFSLISSPNFVTLHHDRAIFDPNTNHFRLFLVSTHSLHSIDYESPSCYEDTGDDSKAIVELKHPTEDEEEASDKLFGSCYGLIYFVCYEECIILWNPCTKKRRRVPNLSTSLSNDAVSFYGLGFDSETNGYKMVRASRSVSGNFTRTEVFNLKGDSWRTIQAFNVDIMVSEQEGMFSNGAIHWQGKRAEKDTILFLEMREENFGEISLPNVGDEKILFYCLGNLKGCLSIISVTGDQTDVDIWLMKEYGVENSWNKLITLSWVGFDCCYTLLPVCFTTKDDVVLDLDSWHLVRFNTSEKTTKLFKKRSTDWHEWVMYMECLVSPLG